MGALKLKVVERKTCPFRVNMYVTCVCVGALCSCAYLLYAILLHITEIASCWLKNKQRLAVQNIVTSSVAHVLLRGESWCVKVSADDFAGG